MLQAGSKKRIPITKFIHEKFGIDQSQNFEDCLEQEILDLVVTRPTKENRWTGIIGLVGALLTIIAAIVFALPSTTATQFWIVGAPTTLVLYIYIQRAFNTPEPENEDLLASLKSDQARIHLQHLLEIMAVLCSPQTSLVREDPLGNDHVVNKNLLKRKNRLNFLLPQKGKRQLVPGGWRHCVGKFYVEISEGAQEIYPKTTEMDEKETNKALAQGLMHTLPVSEVSEFASVYRREFPDCAWHADLLETYRQLWEDSEPFRKSALRNRLEQAAAHIGMPGASPTALKDIYYARPDKAFGKRMRTALRLIK